MAGLWMVWLGIVMLTGQACSAATTTTDSIDWSTQNKVSYCDYISRRRIYKQLGLDIYCQLKVVEVNEQV